MNDGLRRKIAQLLLSLFAFLFCISYPMETAFHAIGEKEIEEPTQISARPQRIVVLPLFAEEMLLEMIGSDRIVGVGHEYYENGEVFSPTMALTKDMQHELSINDAEGILNTKPDMVLLWTGNLYGYETLLPVLEQAGISFFFLDEPQDFDGVISSLTILGEIVGAEARAAEMVQVIETGLAELAQIVSCISVEERIRATHYRNYASSHIFDIIADAANVVSDGGSVFVSNPYYDEIDDELLSEWNPDLITFTPFFTDTDGTLLGFGKDYTDRRVAYLLEKPGLSATTAIENGNVHPLNIHNSQYMLQSATDLAHLAYPDLFSR